MFIIKPILSDSIPRRWSPRTLQPAGDVGEAKNLANQMPDRAKDLHARLVAWHAEVKAPMPTPNKPVAAATATPKTKQGKGKKKAPTAP